MMNIVFWILTVITAVLFWIAISDGFWRIGLVVREIKKRVKKNLNEDAEFEENKEEGK